MKFGVYEVGHEIDITVEADSLDDVKRKLEEQSEEVDFDISELRIVPFCPVCGKPLFTVNFEEIGYLDLNDDGTYQDGEQTHRTYICSECGKIIGGYGQKTWGFTPTFR